MPKLKTRKAALKRYKKTGAGNFLRRHAFHLWSAPRSAALALALMTVMVK
mgnify:CR=1 FL=1